MQAALSFTNSEEIVKFASENNIKILNLCHIPEDGKLKSLSFAVTNSKRVHEIIEFGERVDGSSLFSFLEAGQSDIYIMPEPNRAFLNPFAKIPTLNFVCHYLDENGRPLEVAPKNVLARAEEKLRSATGVVLKALTELEFYILAKPSSEALFQGTPDSNYHETAPFSRFEDLRNEILVTLSSMGIATKYGHSEVGRITSSSNIYMEQHEVELALENLPHMSDAVAIAKWVIRNICAEHGVSVSFSPKMALEFAGSGMHVHLCALRNGENIIASPDGNLSLEAQKIIGGILKFAPSLSAFGNTTPISYIRFIARKESPMHICWGSRNRLALIRIPLWWNFKKRQFNSHKETIEYRAPDAFANTHLLFAGLALAADYGLRHPEEALKFSKDLHIGDKNNESFESLPQSCTESAEKLEKQRDLYEADGIFPKRIIDRTISVLKNYRDEGFWKNLTNHPDSVDDIVTQYLHYG